MSNKPPAIRLATALFTAVWVFGAIKLVRSLSLVPSAGGHGFTIFAFVATYSLMALLIVYLWQGCLLYTSPSPRDKRQSRMPSSA